MCGEVLSPQNRPPHHNYKHSNEYTLRKVMRQKAEERTNAALFNIAGRLSLNTLTLSASPSLNVPHITAVRFVTVDDCSVREQMLNEGLGFGNDV